MPRQTKKPSQPKKPPRSVMFCLGLLRRSLEEMEAEGKAWPAAVKRDLRNGIAWTAQ